MTFTNDVIMVRHLIVSKDTSIVINLNVKINVLFKNI